MQDSITIRLKLNQDANGFVQGINPEAEEAIMHDSLFEEVIEHVGVKGMKWGVRRSRSARYAAKAEARETRKKSKEPSVKRSIKDMSDDELRSVINRIKLEQEFRNLTYQPTIVDKGKGFAGKIINIVGTDIAKTVTKTYATNAIGKYMPTPKPLASPKLKSLPPPLPKLKP